ncbi:MAG: hypothetical protein II815_02315 [Bacteroidales bacterium]|nr:hypothetical protein [Bacteroidales bacterium]
MNEQRFRELNHKVNKGTATKEEKDEYMRMMLEAGKITQDQYDRYKSGEQSDALLSIAMFAGAVLLLGWILKNSGNE